MTVGPIELTAIAHGGVAVGRHDGRVVFVRGGLPGETVLVEVTDTTHERFWRGEVQRVVTASRHRVIPPCPVAERCGGCDFQFVDVAHQRELKRQVVAEQLRRLAGITWTGVVEAVEPDAFGWRTRMRYHRGHEGFGLRAARSHDVVGLPPGGCLIASPEGRGRVGGDGDTCTVTVASSGVAVNGVPGVVTQQVGEASFEVDAEGFWQAHPEAASTLVASVLEVLAPQPGEHALDLFCGVGLFARFLADAGLQVIGIEGNKGAVAHARTNVPTAVIHAGDVAATLRRIKPSADVVVLDPPRAGAGRKCVEQIAATRPRAVAYVSCDPASLARDLAYFKQLGYHPDSIRAFDLYPMTHHVECVVLLTARAQPGRSTTAD